MEMYEFGEYRRWEASKQRAAVEGVTVMSTSACVLPNGEALRTARVSSSNGRDSYVVKTHGCAAGLFVGCTCRAGQALTPCKHIGAVLTLDDPIVVTDPELAATAARYGVTPAALEAARAEALAKLMGAA